MSEQIQNDEIEIDLRDLITLFWHHYLMLLLCLLIGAIFAGIVTVGLITPQYEASSMIYVYSKTTSITSLADLQIGTQLAQDFQTLGTSRPVVENVINSLNLDTTYEAFLKNVTIENPSNTRILKITVRDPSPQMAADISNAMAASLSNRVAEIMSTDKPATVEEAVKPDKPSSPSLGRNVAVGGFLGLFLSMMVIFLQYYFDDTIQTEDDVERYLGLSTLAAIPTERTANTKVKKVLPKKSSKRRAA